MKSLIWNQNFTGWLARLIFKWCRIKIEYIPDDEILWRKVFNSEQIKPNGDLKSAFFRDTRGISCDLSRFSTIKKSMKPIGNRALWIKKPGLVKFSVQSVRSLSVDTLVDVLHDPNNYAHCLFSSTLNKGQAKKLIRMSSFEVVPEV